jgi:ElaB/YqjD/DUF883 family membrane-anchored ribosome-binding protein
MSHAPTKHPGDAENLKDSAVAAKDAVTELASEAGRYASHRIGDAKKSASAMIDTVKAKGGECNDSVVGLIRKHPYKSIAIAAGVGFAAALLLRRG